MSRFDARVAAIADVLPSSPGIYRFYDESEQLIYVGKAKNLRRRISQYRNAKRRKAHAKMRKISREARRLEFEVCADEHSALRLETEWIQLHRPKWNVAGAFYFLYPMLGVRVGRNELSWCYTTEPEAYPGFEFHGAFRSRWMTREAFFAMDALLRRLGHAQPRNEMLRQGHRPNSWRGGYVYGYRQIPAEWSSKLAAFLRGDDFAALGELSLLLLDRPSAVQHRQETEEHLRALQRFWHHEVLSLRRARVHSDFGEYPVPQRERDLLFIAMKF